MFEDWPKKDPDADFVGRVMRGSRTVYCRSCGQTYITSSVEKCTLCGRMGTLLDPDDPLAVRDLIAKKQVENAPLSWYGMIKSVMDTVGAAPLTVLSIALAVTLLGIGLAMVYLEWLSSEADAPAVMALGMLMILVGIVKLMVVACVFRIQWKRVVARNATRNWLDNDLTE